MQSIQTNRLTINPLLSEHDHFILELLNTAGWKEFIGERNVHTVSDARKYIQNIQEKPNTDFWVVTLKDEAAPIGVLSFLKRDYLDHKDIGFAFLPQVAGRGYAFEASSALLNELLAGQDVIYATTIPHNYNSIKLLNKLGFKFIKNFKNDQLALQLYCINKT